MKISPFVPLSMSIAAIANALSFCQPNAPKHALLAAIWALLAIAWRSHE